MKYFSGIVILLFTHTLFYSCKGIAEKKVEESLVEEPLAEKQPEPLKIAYIEIPEGYTKLSEALGDLDKDGKEETVIVYDTPREVEMGTEREIHVYRLGKNRWELWHKSIGAVLPSRHGGMLGDAFEELRIERACIVVEHFGGSREKWNYTHRYRYQNDDWQLIGASIRFGAPCDYWDHFDYNLSTGKMVVKKETVNCDDESQNQIKEYLHTQKLAVLPSMDNIYPGNTEIKIEKEGDTFYY